MGDRHLSDDHVIEDVNLVVVKQMLDDRLPSKAMKRSQSVGEVRINQDVGFHDAHGTIEQTTITDHAHEVDPRLMNSSSSKLHSSRSMSTSKREILPGNALFNFAVDDSPRPASEFDMGVMKSNSNKRRICRSLSTSKTKMSPVNVLLAAPKPRRWTPMDESPQHWLKTEDAASSQQQFLRHCASLDTTWMARSQGEFITRGKSRPKLR
mmetsp:Transcript_65942/g.114796  ORF Transcript_65942/g.114796 Transcript_65942/m.114796 type:complete len:209 (+) Transcript_65942:1-627(+)